MTQQNRINEYGSMARMGAALGISLPVVCRWGEWPSLGRQYPSELLTQGRFKAEHSAASHVV